MTSLCRGLPKLLLNATVIRQGGGLQACAAFVRQLVEDGSAEPWSFALSDVLVAELAGLGVGLPAARTHLFPHSPAHSMAARRRLAALARVLQPDMVFTFFGPAYVRFECPHLCGVADPWVTHADRHSYSLLPSWSERLRQYASSAYKAYWFRCADAWMVEAEVARAGLARRIGVDADRIHLVPNTCAQHYLTGDDAAPLLVPTGTTRILCFSHDYPHKNLGIVPQVAQRLSDRYPELACEFVTTLPKGCEGERRLLAASRTHRTQGLVRNIGTVALQDGPRLYRSCQVLFHPSVLEVFTAVYPEAMAMEVPIVTSDLAYAHGICADAARYFDSGDPGAACDAIAAVLLDPGERNRLVRTGRRRLLALGLPETRNARLLEAVQSLGAQSSREGHGLIAMKPRPVPPARFMWNQPKS